MYTNIAANADKGICLNSPANKTIKATRKSAWKKFADLLLPLLFTFTELRAITVTTFKPPKKPLITVAIPNDRMSLFTLDLLFSGSSLSTAFILNKDSILAIKVMAITALKNS